MELLKRIQLKILKCIAYMMFFAGIIVIHMTIFKAINYLYILNTIPSLTFLSVLLVVYSVFIFIIYEQCVEND